MTELRDLTLRCWFPAAVATLTMLICVSIYTAYIFTIGPTDNLLLAALVGGGSAIIGLVIGGRIQLSQY